MSGVRPYIVRQGDYVAKIAAQLGCSEDEIWNHEKNKELKESGRTKEILAPGDCLFIPELSRHALAISLENTSSYSANVPSISVRIRLTNTGGTPITNEPYLVGDLDSTKKGDTGPDGIIELSASVLSRVVHVIFPRTLQRLAIQVGFLDPVCEESGIRQRFANLGYGESPSSSNEHHATEATIIRYQRDHGLTATGELNDETVQHLNLMHAR